MNLQAIQEIASAVQAGVEAAKRGETTNPFEGVNEPLRGAFHFGWNTQQGGVQPLTVDQLVAQAKIQASIQGHLAVAQAIKGVNVQSSMQRLEELDRQRKGNTGMKIEQSVRSVVEHDPMADKWVRIASGLAEAIVQRALSMSTDELMAFVADTDAGKRIAQASEKEIASAACIVRMALL